MTNINSVQQFYDDAVLREWTRLERHRTEFAVTMRALADYLPDSPATILDIGGGPGRYAITLAQRGYTVTLADLSQNNLDFAEDKANEAGAVLENFVQANALDLSQFPASNFDAVLMFGPLYHLLTHTERLQAVREAKRVLKPKGHIFAAFVTRFAAFLHAAQFSPQWVVDDPDYADRLLTTGVHHESRPNIANDFSPAYFAHPTDVAPLMEEAGFETVNLIGVEGVVSAGNEEQINQLSGQAWEAWVDLNYRIGQDPSIHGATAHLLYVGQNIQ